MIAYTFTMGNNQLHHARETLPEDERWTIPPVDLHVTHFKPDNESEFNVGDQDAKHTITSLVETAYTHSPDNAVIVIGNHSYGYNRLVGFEKYKGLSEKDAQIQFLIDQRIAIDEAITQAQTKTGRTEHAPSILFGVEADLYLDDDGNPYLNPPADVLRNPNGAPDLVMASFHEYGNAENEKERADKLHRGFMYAIESGVVHKFSHPIKELDIIRRTDPTAFNQILETAYNNGIIFEINTGPRMRGQLENASMQDTIRQIIAYGNLVDLGADFHHFGMFKESGLIPPEREAILTSEEQTILAQWSEYRKFEKSFNKQEKALWGNALKGIDLNQSIELDGAPHQLKDIWRIYKAEMEQLQRNDMTNDERTETFVDLRNQLIGQLTATNFTPEIKAQISTTLTELFTLFKTRPENVSSKILEPIFAKTGLTIGDLRRMYGPARRIRREYELPKSQFVNAWGGDKIRKHFNGLSARHERYLQEKQEE